MNGAKRRPPQKDLLARSPQSRCVIVYEDGEDGEEEDDGDENDSFGVNVRGASAYSAPLEDVCMSSCTYIRVIMVNGVCV